MPYPCPMLEHGDVKLTCAKRPQISSFTAADLAIMVRLGNSGYVDLAINKIMWHGLNKVKTNGNAGFSNDFTKQFFLILYAFDLIGTSKTSANEWMKAECSPALMESANRFTLYEFTAGLKHGITVCNALRVGAPPPPIPHDASVDARRVFRLMAASCERCGGTNNERDLMRKELDAMTVRFGLSSLLWTFIPNPDKSWAMYILTQVTSQAAAAHAAAAATADAPNTPPGSPMDVDSSSPPGTPAPQAQQEQQKQQKQQKQPGAPSASAASTSTSAQSKPQPTTPPSYTSYEDFLKDPAAAPGVIKLDLNAADAPAQAGTTSGSRAS
ncbi:hypothetical protein BCR44DRAFT_1458161 [Catenaria anguillulae PL171]|uniref:Uncharacterized protein n=1 Tax=Catenaria anguillulae PL171 TaxID=765915 RepID=A0A1Y2I2A7_9FUNG|nr:hypothetical protein BCR44DRAFT_1458161 [Catenaria anguillulae PL171]